MKQFIRNLFFKKKRYNKIVYIELSPKYLMIASRKSYSVLAHDGILENMEDNYIWRTLDEKHFDI
jgi:hypothetical protein